MRSGGRHFLDPRGVSAGGSPTGRSVNFAIPCKINDLRAVFHVLRQPARTDRARPDMRPPGPARARYGLRPIAGAIGCPRSNVPHWTARRVN